MVSVAASLMDRRISRAPSKSSSYFAESTLLGQIEKWVSRTPSLQEEVASASSLHAVSIQSSGSYELNEYTF